MCGGGPKGPSQEELIAQENAARDRAKAEADKITAEKDAEKQKETQKVLADQVAMAKQDLDRRQRQRTLLGGLQSEEGDLEDENAKSQRKAKHATLLQSFGG
ncbi:MAG: hypothetical protein V4757_06700 [Pseudomonadota bacterium]